LVHKLADNALMLKNKKPQNLKISIAKNSDFEEIWRIFKDVIKDGDTYANDDKTTKKQAYEKWITEPSKTFVAKENNIILGVYLIKPNRVGRSAHIANASYLVDKKARGKGVGKALGIHSIAMAKKLHFKAIQFNHVVSSNLAAINLWKSLGFEIIGTIPSAFNHKHLGYVDAHIMFKQL
jgi:L-amino acid N-acyltransferase YncA